LTAGGVLLLPAAFLLEPSLPELTVGNLLGFTYLGLLGGAATYFLWFRGIARLEPSIVSPLALLSPVTAVILGWLALGQALSAVQILGMIMVFGSVWLGQRVQSRPR
jgi:probable blue pigment (indigoidine) exporter